MYNSAQKYSLRSMDNPSYILDPRFEPIGGTFKEDRGNTYWVDGPDLPRYLRGLPSPEKITFVGHNLIFDACVTSWHWGFNPGLYVCTLAMARQLLAHKLQRLSLDSVSKYLNLPPKGDTVVRVDGMTRQMIIDAGLMDEYKAYCMRDTENAFSIYEWGIGQLPATEIVIADMVLRMATEPRLKLDINKLTEHLAQVKAAKELSLAFAMFGGIGGKEDLMSNDRFAEALQNLGVDPPTKISIRTGKQTWAFAKSDPGLRALEEHENTHVHNLVAARLGHKSTMEETRTARMLNCGSLTFPMWGEQLIPIPLKVAAAHTLRLGGDWKYNAQNWSKLKKKPDGEVVPGTGMIRQSVCTPDGFEIVVADESQIECRINAVFCGQWDLVHQFANGEDPYSILASRIFGRIITKNDIVERFIGKGLVLGGGFGVGAEKIRATIRYQSLELLGTEIWPTEDEAQNYCNTYRQANRMIVQMWYKLKDIIPMMMDQNCNYQLGPIVFMFEKILLPNGAYIHYHNLRYDGSQYWFDFQGKPHRIYGPKLLENIIQALAYIITMHAALRLRKRIRTINAFFVLQGHDELGFLVPREHVETMKAMAREEMTRQVPWMPELPLNCDVGNGLTYGDAK